MVLMFSDAMLANYYSSLVTSCTNSMFLSIEARYVAWIDAGDYLYNLFSGPFPAEFSCLW